MDSDLESASNKKSVKDMDIHPLFEVSEGPERMWGEVGRSDIPSYNPMKASARKKHMHTRKWKDSGNVTVGSHSTGAARDDAENLRSRVRLAHSISKTLDTEPSSDVQDDIKETEQTQISNGSRRNMSLFDNCVDNSSPGSCHSQHRGSRRKRGKERLPAFDEGDENLEARDNGKRLILADSAFASQRSHGVWQKKPHSTDIISPCNTSKSGNLNDKKYIDTSVNGELCSSHVAVGGQYMMKETDFHNLFIHEPEMGIPRHNWFDGAQKNSEPRRLVQTDSFSPCNMVHDKDHAKGSWVRKSVHSELSEGASAHQIHTSDLEGRHVNRKGMVLPDDNFVNDNQQGEAKPHFGRVSSIAGKEVEDRGCRRSTHDLANKATVCLLQEAPTVSKRGKNTPNCLPDRSSEIARSDRNYANYPIDSQCQRWRKLMEGKMKNNSVPSSYGGCSSSTIDGSETSYLQSSRQFPNSESTTSCDSKHCGTVFGPVMEADEMEPHQLRCSNLPEQSHKTPVDSSTIFNQVESDEILARQLQEQFNHELLGFRGSEEDDTWRSASMPRRSPFNHRDTSMDHLYAYYAQLPQSTNRDQTPTSTRRDNYGLEMDYETRMLAEVKRSFNSDQTGQETRHNLLEALEAAFDNSNDMFSENVLHTRHDFNEDDYEMLSALDDYNHQSVGASENQINSLPESVVQSNNIEEACAICLEIPSVGDIIRPLRCLHKFHKKCIDTWLRRKSLCPVCKSGLLEAC